MPPVRVLLPARRQKDTREMKGITGSPQKAAWLQSEFENRPIEQEMMARTRAFSLDEMVPLGGEATF